MSKSRARFLSELLGTTGLVKKAKSALAGADEVIDLDVLPSIPNSKLTNSSITINSSATSLGGSVTLTTANVAENTNLYYTDARADARIVNAGSANWNTAYTYSQVGHLPLAGGTLTGNLSLGDNVKAQFGAGNDLEIFSNGSTALLKAGNATSDIRIESDNRIVIADRGFNEAFAVFNDDSDVKLYHDGSQKFATTSTGIDITGTVTSSGLAVDTDTLVVDSTNNRVGIGTDAPASKLHISGNSDVSDEDCMLIIDDVDGSAGSRVPAIMFRSVTGGTTTNQARIRGTDTQGIVMSGSAALGDDLVVQAGGVGIGTASPKTTLNIGANDSGQGPILTLENTDTSITTGDVIGQIDFYANDGSTNGTGPKVNIKAVAQSSAGTVTELTFGTSPSSSATAIERMRIDASGNVGIGTNNPLYKLHVSGSGSQRLRIEKTDAGGDADLQLYSPSDSTQWILFGDSTSGNNSGVIKYVHSTNKMHFRTNDVNDRLVISSDGNVGIGTTSPDALLHVSATSPHIDIGPQGGNRGKIGYHSNDVIIGSTSSTGSIILKNNISSTDSPQTSGDTKVTIHDVGMTIHSDTYNILAVQTDSNNDQTSTDGIIKITNNNGSSDVTKAEFRWDESEDLVHVSYGDHGRHVSINSSGNVGINTGSTSPTATLDVAGTALVENAKLKAIAESNTDTAVDVFVYDTRKDSDGGAWRKRTQHTSWYNETLNTSTRGSRREFPAVAVIVVEFNSITIYDGDDPSLPLWWSYVGNTSFSGGSPFYSNTLDDNNGASVTALNGSIILGVPYANTNGGVRKFDFIADRMKRYTQSSTASTNGSIAPLTAMGSVAAIPDGENIQIVNYTINDVAMTVLPNAPIDADTGLPVPTIAVATNGGVSVIKDDGNVYDSSDTNAYGSVEFIDGRIVSDRNTSDTRYFISQKVSSITADSWNPYEYYTGNFSTGYPLLRSDTGSSIITKAKDHSVRGSNVGLSFWDWEESDNDSSQGAYFNNSLMSYVASDHNTGWMPGDIKLATLSSTSTVDNTDYVGGAGTFANAGDWSTDSQWSVSGGTASYSGSGAAYISRTPTSNFVYGNWYYAELDVTSGGAGTLLLVNRHISGIAKPYTNGLTNVDVGFIQLSGTKYYAIWKQNSNNQSSISLYATSAVTVDNFKVYEIAAHDRSVNNNHVIKYGTINSSAVATGAELVGYSGFSSSNYLKQPYNSDLNFGTDNFSVSVWAQHTPNGSTAAFYIFDKADSNGTNRFAVYYIPNSNRLDLYSPTSGQHVVANGTFPSISSWSLITVVRRNGIGYIYHNGNLITSGSFTENLTGDSTAQLSIGTRYNQVEPWTIGSLALLRISATAPTPEQIAKMYNDEKHLFATNAKAKIAGTSDAVTALAYDDDTGLLHVGSSWGRSVFQGLNRVEYSTDVVTTAISASNGFIVEE